MYMRPFSGADRAICSIVLERPGQVLTALQRASEGSILDLRLSFIQQAVSLSNHAPKVLNRNCS